MSPELRVENGRRRQRRQNNHRDTKAVGLNCKKIFKLKKAGITAQEV